MPVRVRVYIATTEGPVLVQRLAPEEGLAEAELSAVCLDGTPTRLPITGAYTYFVRDHVRDFSGGAAFRLDLDRRIDGGDSWMLGAWSAHLLLSEDRLAVGDQAADMAVFATGEVAVAAHAERRAEIRPVGHVGDKIARLAERAAAETAGGRQVLLLVPRENAAEAEGAHGGLPAPLRERLALRVVADTGDVRSALTPPGVAAAASAPARRGKRRRIGRLAAALLLCAVLGTAATGFVAWRNLERDWDALRLNGRYAELVRSLDGFFLPVAAQRFRDKWRGEGTAAQFAVTVAARRPADGGSCSGMRFRERSMVAHPVVAPGRVFRLDRLRSLCGFEVHASADKAAGGHAWISLRLLAADGAPAALLPPSRLVSGGPDESPVVLSQNLSLYLQEEWAWTLTAVWAPVPSEDIVPLLDVAHPGVLGALEDLGLSVVRARIELAP